MKIVSSFRFKLSIILFCVVGLVTSVLFGTLIYTAIDNQKLLVQAEKDATVQFILQSSRPAINSRNYVDLQLMIENLVKDPHLESVVLADHRKHVVVSSIYPFLGKTLDGSEFKNNDWLQVPIKNVTGQIGTLAIQFSHAPTQLATNKLFKRALLLTIPVLVTIFLFSWLLATWLTRRLEKVEAAVRRVSSGELNFDIDISGNDEIAQLATSFQTMGRTIHAQLLQLAESEKKYKSVINHQKDVLLLHKIIPEGYSTYSEINDAAVEFYGYTREELLTMGPADIIPPEILEEHKRSGEREKMLKEGHLFRESVHITKAGERIPVEVSGTIVKIAGEDYILSMIHDIRQRKKKEQQIWRFNQILKKSISEIYIYDSETFKFIDANSGACKNLGYSLEELKRQTTLDIKPLITREAFIDIVAPLASGHKDRVVYRTEHQRKDGTLYPVEIFLQLIPESPPVYLAIAMDITERKQAEQERLTLEAQFQQMQKMEAIGILAGGIAHDFNNILGAIIGYAEMIRDDLPAHSTSIQDIDQILIASNRAKELVKQILAFSRQAKANKILLQPITIIKEAIKMLRPSLPATIEIEQDLDANAGSIVGDPNQFHQVIVNLCTNAFQAMEMKGGTLNISLHKIDLITADLALEPHMQPGRYLRLSIKDTGEGIKPEIKDKLFDPFFTTKEVGKGTGMGLATVHGIVQQLGGSIIFDSRLGEGTVFHITLPLAEEHTQLGSESSLQAPQKGNERILFVDDEEMLAKLSKTMLERAGYSITTCGSSLDALEMFKNQPDAFDLLITDQTMPNMTGVELSGRILQIRPELPIILCTGYSSLISKEEAKSCGIKGFAMKPLAKDDLTKLIRKILDKK